MALADVACKLRQPLAKGRQLPPGLGKEMPEVGRKLLHMLDASCLQPQGRMMHRCGKERLLDVSCLQPLAEGCVKIGRSAC